MEAHETYLLSISALALETLFTYLWDIKDVLHCTETYIDLFSILYFNFHRLVHYLILEYSRCG